jgi:hypothetical protein
MEAVFQQQTEELNRSRSDYTALFQNFKQSRILFEEREYVSKNLLQRSQNDNLTLNKAVYQLTNELNLKKVDFNNLLEDLERSTAGNKEQNKEQNRISNLTLQEYRNEIDLLKRKTYEQKMKIKTLKAMEKGFENDLRHYEHATKLLELNETTKREKYDNLLALYNNNLIDIKLQSDLILKQSIDIERLNIIISLDTVPKSELESCLYKLKEKEKEIEDMIHLDIHQSLKDKCFELQFVVEKMVSIDKYNTVILELEILRKKVAFDEVSLQAFASLQVTLTPTLTLRIKNSNPNSNDDNHDYENNANPNTNPT